MFETFDSKTDLNNLVSPKKNLPKLKGLKERGGGGAVHFDAPMNVLNLLRSPKHSDS